MLASFAQLREPDRDRGSPRKQILKLRPERCGMSRPAHDGVGHLVQHGCT
jgi:hypothetical protein